jgi:hypothetical protein
VRLTVQMLEEFGPTVLGLHDRAETDTDVDATRSMVVFAELPLSLAAMVALELLLTAAVDTVKLADVAPTVTVIDGVTVNVVFEFERVKLAPPTGAA